MSEPKDGGPAFPFPGQVTSEYAPASVYDRGTERDRSGWRTISVGGGPGMSLRDYFAGQAIAAVVPHLILTMNTRFTEKQMAEVAYVVADAMLAVREGKR